MTDSAEPQFTEVISLYCGCMEEIKLRVEVARFLFNAQLHSVPKVESLCLQIRKILELIALASLVAVKDEYAKQYEKFAQHWHAKYILRDIEKINPSFYPIPSKQILDPITGKPYRVEEVTEGFLTRDEFLTVYETCAEMLHAGNPFGPAKDFEAVARQVLTWVTRIMALLNHHQIQLIRPDLQLWVIMEAKEDSRVHGFIMKKNPI